jgi:hypothetical protein
VEWVEEDPARQDIVGASRIRYTTAPDSRPLPETAYRELREIALIPRGGAWKERLKALTDAWGIGSATWESCTEPFSAVNRIVQSDTVFQNVRSLLCEGR